MEESIFYQLSLVMVIAAAVSLLLRAFRQPLIIGYILTGILVGPSLLHVIHSAEAFESFSQIGITLLLFVIGLGLNVGIVKNTGKPTFATVGIVFGGIGIIGLVASLLFGFSLQASLVMACALLFSSTIIVVKSLSDKKEQNRLYGQIAIGVLLVEDLMATIALLLVSTSTGGGSAGGFIDLLMKGVALAAALTFLGGWVLPKLSRLFAASQELLYVFALAWAFGVASIFQVLGFSIEVGALFAGVALAHLPYVQAIASKLKPLRDFFIVLFFIGLGEELGLDNLSAALVPALVFSTLIMVFKPLLIMTSLGMLGYTKQTSFKTAVHLSQISEFSIVLVVLAVNSGIGNQNMIAITTLTALLTIAASAYLMKYDDRLYKRFSRQLSFFERTKTKKEIKSIGHYPLMLLGYNEGSNAFVKTFRAMKKRYVVIDYDPDVIESLERQHIHHLYGDVTDTELLEEINVHKSELIISTITSASTNRMLVDYIMKTNDKAVFICHADTFEQAEYLYKAGAAFVLMPHHIGDEHINQFIKRNGATPGAFTKYRGQQMTKLGNIAMY